jgi:hypothetical protein
MAFMEGEPGSVEVHIEDRGANHLRKQLNERNEARELSALHLILEECG